MNAGAKVMNPRGNKADRTFVAPTILFPVDESMKVYQAEQFGPLVPVQEFEDLNDIFKVFISSYSLLSPTPLSLCMFYLFLFFNMYVYYSIWIPASSDNKQVCSLATKLKPRG